jgi:hypothetical protein
VYDSGPASIQKLFDAVTDRRAHLAQIHSRTTRNT